MCVRLGHNEVLLEGDFVILVESLLPPQPPILPHEQLESSSTKVKATEHMGQKSAGMTQTKVADEHTKMAPPIMAVF